MLTALFMLYLFTAMWPTSLDVNMAAPRSQEGSSGTPLALERPGQAAKVDAEHSLGMLPSRVVPPAWGVEKLQRNMRTPARRHHSPPHRATLAAKGSLKGSVGSREQGQLLLLSPQNSQGQAKLLLP